jgi:hypothetical protein
MGYKIAVRTGVLLTGSLLALLPALLPSCTSDECSRADDLVAACAPPDAPTPAAQQSMTLACSGARLCHARCINASSCLEIEALQCFDSVACPPVPCGSVGSKLAQCILACSGVATPPATDAGTCDAGTTDGG